MSSPSGLSIFRDLVGRPGPRTFRGCDTAIDLVYRRKRQEYEDAVHGIYSCFLVAWSPRRFDNAMSCGCWRKDLENEGVRASSRDFLGLDRDGVEGCGWTKPHEYSRVSVLMAAKCSNKARLDERNHTRLNCGNKVDF